MLKTKKINKVFGKLVYTDEGQLFGKVEEAILTMGKVYGWAITPIEGSYLDKIISGAKKGVIVPHNLVKAIGDIVIISKAAIKIDEEEDYE